MMSSFTTLKKNSRFKSACPSSGPVTFCEGGPGHVRIRSHRVLTRGVLHQPCASLKSRIESTFPSSGPASFCEGDPSHVHARSRRVHARSFRCTILCNFLSASVGIFAAAVRLYSAAPLWVSWHQTLSWASSASGSLPAVPLGQLAPNTFLGLLCLWVFTGGASGSVGTKHFLGPPLPLGLYFSAGCISGRLH